MRSLSLPLVASFLLLPAAIGHATSVANFWISAQGSVEIGSTPPGNSQSIPTLTNSVGSSGTFFIWARPQPGINLKNWSLNVVSTNPDALVLETSRVVPDLEVPAEEEQGICPMGDVCRWEYVEQALASPIAIDEGLQMPISKISGIAGFTLFGEAPRGIGIGDLTAASQYDDEFYNESTDAWLLAEIDYRAGNAPGQADIFLQIGERGLSHCDSIDCFPADPTGNSAAILGALNDPILYAGPDEPAGTSFPAGNRGDYSMTPEAFFMSVDSLPPSADFNGDGLVDGRDLLSWQRGFGITSSANKSQGDADNNGAVNATDLGIWEAQFGSGSGNSMSLSQIPEPGSLAILLSALSWGFYPLRRR